MYVGRRVAASLEYVRPRSLLWVWAADEIELQ